VVVAAPPAAVPDAEAMPRSMVSSTVSSMRRADAMAEADADAVARWMIDTLARHGYLYQEVAVTEVAELFGERFVYTNAVGNRAIRKDVLQVFNKLAAGSIAWEIGPRAWRKRSSDQEAAE
jgi:hypothetical protein